MLPRVLREIGVLRGGFGVLEPEVTICPFRAPNGLFKLPKHYVLKGTWPISKRNLLGEKSQKDKWYPIRACTGGGGVPRPFLRAGGTFVTRRRHMALKLVCSGKSGVLQGVLPRVKSTLGSTPWSTPDFPEHSREHPPEHPDFPEHPREHFREHFQGFPTLAPL